METFAGTAVDGGSAGGGGLAGKSSFFQQPGLGIVSRRLAQGGEDAGDSGLCEQRGDTGPEGRVIDSFVTGPGEAIDSDGTRAGQMVNGQVHLDRRMDFQQEEYLFTTADEVSAEGIGDFHPVIDFPQAIIGVGQSIVAIEFPPEDFPDYGAVRCFVDGSYRKGCVSWVGS